MATTLTKSDPAKLAFRLNPPGSFATLQAAQDFSVNVDLAFGAVEHAAYRANENGALSMPPGAWVPGARYLVIADRQGATTRRGLTAIPAADADYYLGLVIGGFTIGEDNHPDPSTAWDLASPPELAAAFAPDPNSTRSSAPRADDENGVRYPATPATCQPLLAAARSLIPPILPPGRQDGRVALQRHPADPQ